jgi:hypothetical protein
VRSRSAHQERRCLLNRTPRARGASGFQGARTDAGHQSRALDLPVHAAAAVDLHRRLLQAIVSPATQVVAALPRRIQQAVVRLVEDKDLQEEEGEQQAEASTNAPARRHHYFLSGR